MKNSNAKYPTQSRRDRFYLIGLAILLLAAHLVAQSPLHNPVNWSEFHTQDMARWNPYETTLNTDSVKNLQVKWTYNTGGLIESSPTVVNGVVYFGSNNGSVYALNALTGAEVWISTLFPPREIPVAVAVANGVVYVAGGDTNFFIALDANTGKQLWVYDVASTMYSSPAVADGVVYFGSGDGVMYALGAGRTGGKLLWEYQTASFVESSPVIAHGMVYFVSGESYLYALNASTGAFVWDAQVGFLAKSSPAVADGVVYTGSNYSSESLCAFNASNGKLLWSYPTGSDTYTSPAVANGVVYIGSDDGTLSAVSPRTVSLFVWSYPTEGEISSPAVANGVVYVGSDNLNVYALDAHTGEVLWEYPTGGPVDSSPIVINGMVYVGSFDGSLYAFGLPSD